MDLPEKVDLRNIDEGDFELFFRTYYASLCRYAQSFVRDSDEAEEIVQTSFIHIWEKRTSLNIDTSLKAYLFRAVRNGCLNHIKFRKVRMEHAANQIKTGEPTHEGVSDGVTANELEHRILAAMKELPEQCRLVFQLSRFEELRYQEIADQLHLSVKTVENQMGKALKIMRRELKDYLPTLIFCLNALAAW